MGFDFAEPPGAAAAPSAAGAQGADERYDVVVVGGGIAGLAAAVALARKGLSVCVAESRSAPRADAWGFLLWPAGTSVLASLGMLDEVARRGASIARMRRISTTGGETCADLLSMADLGRFVGILPSALETAAAEAVAASGATFIRGAVCSVVGRSPWRVEVAAADGRRVVEAGVLLAADGPASPLRRAAGLKAWRWRPPGQAIVTSVAGAVPGPESRQVVGPDWSLGTLDLGFGRSWLYAVVPDAEADGGYELFARLSKSDDYAAAALEGQASSLVLRPWSVHVPRWTADGLVLVGDAAHGVLPHLGFGANLALEDVPVLADVVAQALAAGDVSAARLARFQQQRRHRVAYLQRVSEMWAYVLTARLPGVRGARDAGLRFLAKRPDGGQSYLRDLCTPDAPPRSVRLAAGLR